MERPPGALNGIPQGLRSTRLNETLPLESDANLLAGWLPIASTTGFRANPGKGGSGEMWDVIKAAIQGNGTTIRFIAIIAALAAASLLISLH